jgi:hypothetical protein
MSSPTAAPGFPAGELDPRGRLLAVGGLRARAYAALAPELLALLPRWYAELPREGVVLHERVVVRVGSLVVKRFPPPSVFGWWRAPRSTRSAARHFWCRPVPSPRPLVALWRDFRGPSVLVREFVAGALLAEAPAEGPSEVALADFLVALARHDVLHGDLHPRNLLWDGTQWWLLDVDGVRHGLHSRTRVWRATWARLALYLGPERARALFVSALPRCGPRWQLAWDEVVRDCAAMNARRAYALPVAEPRP